ncbi:MAG: hypothetical protein NVS3B25_05150 [Hymenobacter sp.]
MSTATTSISAEIRHVNDLFEATFERGDAAGMAALYTSDAVLLPPGMETMEGAAGIQAFWQGAMDAGLKQLKLKSWEVEELGDTAIELGYYSLFGADEQPLDQGKFIVVWKEQQGRWLLHRDIYNSSVPAPAQ